MSLPPQLQKVLTSLLEFMRSILSINAPSNRRLGQGLVLTAARVVGRYPFATIPHVLIAGEDLPAKVIKEGSPDQTDLALLAVDQQRLPVSLRLRQNPLCKGNLQIGTNVIIVYPERTTRSRVSGGSQPFQE